MPRRRLLPSMIVLAVALPAGGTAAEEPSTPAAVSVGGAVEHPGDLPVDALRKLPATTETVFFHTGHGTTTGTFTGVSLWTLLQKVGIKTDPAVHNERLRKYIVAAGADGYYAVLALAEIDPEFGGEQVIVAYDQGGKPIGDGCGGARLVVPGDKGGGRNVMNLKSLTVRDAAP